MDRPGFNRSLVGFVALAALLGFGLGWLQNLLQARQQSSSTDLPTLEQPVFNPSQNPTQTVFPVFTPLTNEALAVVDAQAPDFTLENREGEEVSLSDYSGQVVLLNFWASWCPPCKDEMPALQAALDQHAKEGFSVLAINTLYLDTRADAEAFLEELNIDLPVLYDPDGSVAEDSYGVLGLPTSVWIARDGTLHEFHVGPLEEEDIEAVLARLLPEN